MLTGSPGPKQYHDVGRHFLVHGARYVERVLVRRNSLRFSVHCRPRHVHRAS